MSHDARPGRFIRLRRLATAALALPLLLVGAAGARAQSMGSNTGGLNRRVQYDIEYLTTGSGAHARRSHLLMLLTRGAVDTLQPPVDSAVTGREQHDAEQAGMRTHRNSVAVPCGGHWYAATYTRDSVWVLDQALRRPGGDTAFVVMVDRADHVGGDPAVAGTAAITVPMPVRFWTLDTDPFQQTAVLSAWLRRQPAVREFLQ
ncbi:MAG TPA: hypothetical protein VEH62_13790 [Gemmatimonadales bacterium]|nr:hypothetical protein [Gemmatimonadales bacterium]